MNPATIRTRQRTRCGMPFITRDGVRLRSESPMEIIKELHSMAVRATDTPDDVEDYMEEMAYRVMQFNGSEVPTHSPDAFVQGLLRAGTLQLVA